MKRGIFFLSMLYLTGPFAKAQEPRLILPIGHTLGVSAAIFSPDGKRMVTTALDYTAKIWDVETGRLLANLIGHTDTLYSANYSPDGKKIVTTSEDGTAKVWDANTTRLLANLDGQAGRVYQVEFSPDGKKILTNSDNANAKIWDATSGKLLADLIGHTIAINNLCFSRDGKKITTAADDNTAKIWYAESGKLLTDLTGHRLPVWSSAFSPDGKKIITGSADSTARLWDGESGALLAVLKGHKDAVKFVSFSADGKRILSGSDDGTAKIWNAENGNLLFDLLGKKMEAVNKNESYYPDIVSATQFSPDGKKVLTVYLDSSVKIWDAVTGKLLKDIKRPYIYVNTASFSADGKKFALALASGTIEIYDIAKGTLSADLKGEANHINSVLYSVDGKRMLISSGTASARLYDTESGAFIALLSAVKETAWGTLASFSPDGKKVVSFAANDVPRIWDATTGTHLFDLTRNKRVWFPQFSSDGKKVFTFSSDSTINIWDAVTGKLLFDIKGQNHISLISVSPNDKIILSSSYRDSVFKTWDVETGRLMAELKIPGKKIVNARLSPDGGKILATSPDSTVTVWDAYKGSVLLTLKGPANDRYWTDFSPDGKKIFSILEGGTKIWDAETGLLILDINVATHFFNYKFSPDGTRFINGYDDGSIKIWDLKKREVINELKGHTATMMRLEYSSDGKKIISASQDGTAKIWDAETGALLADLKEHTFWVLGAQFSPDGRKIITYSLDNTAKVWDAQTGNSLYTFIPINKEDYLVLDKYNHFDGTEAARKLLYFTCGTEVIELDQVKDQLWVPNLIERILNGETINAPRLSDLNVCNLTPLVDTMEQSALQYRFRITPRMGGIGSALVYVNNIEVKRYNLQQLQKQKDDYLLSIDKKELQGFFVPKKENVVTVKALTAKNSISSRAVSINEKGNERNEMLPNLYAVIVGVSDYKGEELDLRFAAKDAVDMANAITISAKKLLNTDGKEHVFVYKIHTAAGRDKFPEKNGIREIFTEIGSKALPNDILMIFFAGHGVVESEKNQFYFLTADASGATVSGALKNVGISTEELAEWIKPQVMKAQKRILIFDACNSGQAIKEIISFNKNGKDLLASRGDDKGKQIKAIEKLNEKSGMFILAASASDQKAYEIGKYNQGALTYSLLKAIKEQPDILEDRQYLNISRWFNAAEKSVNELARETGARQQPQLVSTTNFNIGLVDDDVRNKIVLPFEKPLVTRSEFRNIDLRIDNLKLRTMVDKEVDELSGNDNNSVILFSPEYDGVNVYAISGDYKISGNDVSVSIILTKGGTEIKTRFEITGKIDNTNIIAKSIAQKAADWFKNNH